MNRYFITLVYLALIGASILELNASAEESSVYTLPWPPTLIDRQAIGAILKDSLRRSVVPEAAELLKMLPSSQDIRPLVTTSDSKNYIGEWRLGEDGLTLWTVRVRNELIRHYYKVHFTQRQARWSGSDLQVFTVHALVKREH